jgi:hypothetical protein
LRLDRLLAVDGAGVLAALLRIDLGNEVLVRGGGVLAGEGVLRGGGVAQLLGQFFCGLQLRERATSSNSKEKSTWLLKYFLSLNSNNPLENCGYFGNSPNKIK